MVIVDIKLMCNSRALGGKVSKNLKLEQMGARFFFSGVEVSVVLEPATCHLEILDDESRNLDLSTQLIVTGEMVGNWNSGGKEVVWEYPLAGNLRMQIAL